MVLDCAPRKLSAVIRSLQAVVRFWRGWDSSLVRPGVDATPVVAAKGDAGQVENGL